jgi:hypothetical protein
MPQGLDHVEAALARIERAADMIGTLEDTDEGWRSGAVTRLATTMALLRTITGRFFLKSKVCLPFAKKCEDTAQTLDALLAEQSAQPTPDGQGRLDAALEALEKAVRTLDERSMMKGMAIT